MTEISDRSICVLAQLMVDQKEGRGGLDTYGPFVAHCLAKRDDAVVSTPVLQEALKSEWGIDLPQAVINEVMRALVSRELVAVDKGVYKPDRDRLRSCDLGEQKARADRARNELLAGIRAFASDRFGLEWSDAKAGDALHSYSEGFSSRILAAALTGGSINGRPPDSESDRYVIHRFASHVKEQDQRLFDALVIRVKGRMLADRMYYLGENRNDVPSLEKVEVYLDGPVILFVLGHAGPEIRGHYAEMLEMLEKQAAVVRCFDHSVTEGREILDAAAHRSRTGKTSESFHGDVVSFLVRSGKDPVEIELMSERLPNDLLKLGINPVETPARKEHLQSDEDTLDKRLERALKYSHKHARDRDIDSLTAIYRLRDGKSTRDLADCRALFVTHNFTLFRVATSFFRGKDRRAVSLCAHDAALTTMLWLREPHAMPDLPKDRLIADAYAALNPKPELWKKYNEEIDRLRSSGGLEEEDAVFLRYGREAQEALMDETRGDPEAFATGTVSEVLQRAQEVTKARADKRVEDAESRAAAATSRLEHSRNRVRVFSRRVGSFIATAALLVVSILIVIGMVFGPLGPLKHPFVPGVLQVAAVVAFLVATAATMFFRRSLLEYRASTAQGISARLESTGFKLMGLGDQESEE